MYNIYVYYISGHYDQVKPHSSPWFSSACAAEEAFIDQFFAFTNRINRAYVKPCSGRLLTVGKGFLKLPNLLMLMKQEFIT